VKKRNILKKVVLEAPDEIELFLIKDALGRMEEEERLILEYIASGYSWDEITSLMHISKEKISKALNKLKKILS